MINSLIAEKPVDTNKLEVLTDTFGRVHDYLRLSITEHCNLRCVYCMPAEGIATKISSHYMSRSEVLEIAKVFIKLGVKKIRLTGGEPLVRKDAHDIIEDLGKLNLQLHISTNGILIDKFVETFKSAGIRSVNISLDSLLSGKQNLITRDNHLQKIKENIALLLENKMEVKLNTVLIKDINDDEILDFVELTRNGNLSVRFIEFMPFNGNNWNLKKAISEEEILRVIRAQYGTEDLVQIAAKDNDTARIFKVKSFRGNIGIISTVSNPFCSTCNRLRITADGKLKNCLFSQGETDLLTPYRKGENIIPLIMENVKSKKKARGGANSTDEFADPAMSAQNRSMISIGG